MLPVTVRTPHDELRFETVKHARITPVIAAVGLSQAVTGTNDAGLAEGFRLEATVVFEDGEILETDRLFAGPKAFANSLGSLTAELGTWLQNPIEEAFPQTVEFQVTPLQENPLTSIDNLRLSHRAVSAGDTLEIDLELRDFQANELQESVTVPISPAWVGRKLEVVVANGARLDLMTGAQRTYPVSQIRDLSAYIDVLHQQRSPDGLYVAVVSPAEIFSDQTTVTTGLPASLARIARDSDDARYQQRRVREVLWETHLLPDRLVPGSISQSLVVTP